MSSKPENPFETLFSTPEGMFRPQLSFYVLLLISKKEFDISQGVMNFSISNMRNFYPLFIVFPDFTKSGNLPKQAIKKNPLSYLVSG